MTIALEEAEQFSNFTVFGFGLGLVFIGLISIILICAIMGTVCKRVINDAPKAAPAPQAQAPKAAVIANKGEFVAAVSAAIAEDLGTDVSGIRVLSIKKL